MHRTLAALLLLSMAAGRPSAALADDVTATSSPQNTTQTTLVDSGPNRLLLATGGASFAFAYAGAAWVGATSSRSADRPLLIPFAGPWVALRAHVAAACDATTTPCGQQTTYAALTVADGLMQAAGAVQIALAFLHRDLQEAREPVARMAIAPSRPPGGGLGVSAVGEF